MSEVLQIDRLIITLQRARGHALEAGMDHHFISEVEHLIATAKHNLEEAKKENAK